MLLLYITLFSSLILASNPSFRFLFETKNKNYVMFEARFRSRGQLSTEWIATLHTQTKQSNTITILFLGNSQLKVWKIHLLLHHITEGRPYSVIYLDVINCGGYWS